MKLFQLSRVFAPPTGVSTWIMQNNLAVFHFESIMRN